MKNSSPKIFKRTNYIISFFVNLLENIFQNCIFSGPPSFGASQAPGFNQQPFGQPTPSTLSTLAPSGGHSNVPSHSSAGGFGPSSPSGFPSTAAPSSKGIYKFSIVFFCVFV